MITATISEKTGKFVIPPYVVNCNGILYLLKEDETPFSDKELGKCKLRELREHSAARIYKLFAQRGLYFIYTLKR